MNYSLAVLDLKEQLEKATVSALYYYPIKSCGGTAIQNGRLTLQGLEYDRRWMVVEANTGRFLTQRELPQMALISPSIEDQRLRVEAPGMAKLEIELHKEGESLQVTVWKDRCPAVDQGREVAAWFSE